MKVKLSEFEFNVREGEVNYAKPYAASGVQQMSRNRIRLTATPESSAGLLGPVLGDGTYQFKIYCRAGNLDPFAVMGLWLMDDISNREFTFFECSRWGDENNPNNLYITTWGAGVAGHTLLKQEKFTTRAFYTLRVTMVVKGTRVRAIVEGAYSANGANPALAGTWKEVARFDHDAVGEAGYNMCQLRAAIWIPKKGLCMPDSASRGPLFWTLDSMTYSTATEFTL